MSRRAPVMACFLSYRPDLSIFSWEEGTLCGSRAKDKRKVLGIERWANSPLKTSMTSAMKTDADDVTDEHDERAKWTRLAIDDLDPTSMLPLSVPRLASDLKHP